MSEKVTFRDLIESIAEETDHSKQFTHDFLKDFVDVINDGLAQDGNVNIAGFGKFKLKRVDEREGYNPQTEEKITIPAHNKIVFKPYKDVRELVNAPYAHLEPELLDDEGETEHEEDKKEKSEQDDFIPTGPPTSLDTEDEPDADEKETDDPFGFDESKNISSSSLKEETDSEESEDEEDIVEFQPENEQNNEEIDRELSEFIGAEDQGQSQEENHTEKDEKSESTDNNEDATEEVETEETANYDPFEEAVERKPADNIAIADQNQRDRKKPSSLPSIIAAAFILLLIGIGAWYFSIVSESTSPQMTTQETVTNSEVSSSDNTGKSAAESQSEDEETSSTQAAKQSQEEQKAASTDQTQQAVEQDIAEGQTLWSIAEDTYGNPRLWPWIYGNNESLDNPDLIIAGNSLSVPLPSGPQNSLSSADSVGVSKGFLATYEWYKNNQSPKAKHHLWAAKVYHENIRDIADVKIDKADLSYANKAR